MAMLGAAVRFVHFALFEATLLSPASYAVDTLYLLVLGSLAWRMTRAAQMATQYYWLYERTGPLTWRERAPAAKLPQETGRIPGDRAAKTGQNGGDRSYRGRGDHTGSAVRNLRRTA